MQRDAAALFSSKLQSPRVKGNESFSVKVYDNWLDPQVDLPSTNLLSNRVGISQLLPQKQRFTV